MQPYDLRQTLRRLERGGWLDAARRFAASLRGSGSGDGRLLVVGTPEDEPWHLTAHLDDAARWGRVPLLSPVLVRWQVPDGAPPHLAVGIDAVPRAGSGATVLVAAPAAGDALLERLSDARRRGATVLALHGGGPLDELAHEALALPDLPNPDVGVRLETASHVLSAAAAGTLPRRRLLRVRG